MGMLRSACGCSLSAEHSHRKRRPNSIDPKQADKHLLFDERAAAHWHSEQTKGQAFCKGPKWCRNCSQSIAWITDPLHIALDLQMQRAIETKRA